MDIGRVAHDLVQEQRALDQIVAGLTEDQWGCPTPSLPWTVADQIAHLVYYDHAAVLAITEPPMFSALADELRVAAAGGAGAVDDLTLGNYRTLTASELLTGWRQARAALAEAASTLGEDTRVTWFGPSMGSKSFLTARLMEVWAHGQDVLDAIGAARPATDRLRHIARLGYLTRRWSYENRGLKSPDTPIRLELTSPSSETWETGPEDAIDFVKGPALEFCLVVTQRRHVDDTGLVTTPTAREWLLIAQAFAGPATDGPAAGTRP